MVDDPNTEVDEAHHFAPHYDLHVWLYRENPKGMFAQFNPKASCEHHKAGGHH
jgi:ABC-type Zn2+ transport system substrate-binding protein/surface adhesin